MANKKRMNRVPRTEVKQKEKHTEGDWKPVQIYCTESLHTTHLSQPKQQQQQQTKQKLMKQSRFVLNYLGKVE